MPKVRIQQKIPYNVGVAVSRFFVILTLQDLLYKNVYEFFLETNISKNMCQLKRRWCILPLQ